MRGADEFAKLFETGQYGRFYLVSGNRACGARFRVFVLPAGERAHSGGPYHAPLNRNAVEVHEFDARLPIKTRRRGDMNLGNWQQEFVALVEARCAALGAQVLQAMTENSLFPARHEASGLRARQAERRRSPSSPGCASNLASHQA